jgi:hypothetical protein
MNPKTFRGGSRAALAATALALLAGCASMPVTSMVRLARTDFSTVDPGALRVAVKLPQGIFPRRDRVRLVLTATIDGVAQKQEFVLADLADPGELARLRGDVPAGFTIHGFRLAPPDLPRLSTFRADLLARKKAGAHGSMSLAVAADACRAGALPDAVPLTTYLRTEQGGDFFPLVRDVDLRKAIPAKDGEELLPPCR